MKTSARLLLAALVLNLSTTTAVFPEGLRTEARAESPSPAQGSALAALEGFNAALKAGDTERALSWLAPDLLVFESGGAERSKAEYAEHHLAQDMAFLKGATVELLRRQVHENGDLNWIVSEFRIRTTAKDRDIDLRSIETAILKRTPAGWRIAHLHWSSAPFKP